MRDVQPMTVVFDRREPWGPILIRTAANHYSLAVTFAADEAADLDEDDLDDPSEDMDMAVQLWLDDQVEAIRVYKGWPPNDSHDVAGLELLHSE